MLTYLNKLNGIPLNTPPRSDPLSLAGMCVSRVSCVARQVRSGPWWRGQQRCEMAARRPRGAGGGLRRGGTATTPDVPPDDGARSYSREHGCRIGIRHIRRDGEKIATTFRLKTTDSDSAAASNREYVESLQRLQS